MKTALVVVKFVLLKMIMPLIKVKSRLILVPAAAVRREGQALFAITGCKKFKGRKVSFLLKFKAKL